MSEKNEDVKVIVGISCSIYNILYKILLTDIIYGKILDGLNEEETAKYANLWEVLL